LSNKNASAGQSGNARAFRNTAETLRPRLHSLMTPWMNEGFFADVVVLVEGEDDRVAIQAVAKLLSHDLEFQGVSVIPCGGKSNLDKAAAVFLALSIPTYVIWDSDGHLKDSPKCDQIRAVQENRRLLRLMGGWPEDWPNEVAENFACFATNLDLTLQQEIGQTEYDQILADCQKELGISKRDNAKKNPAVISALLEKARSSGRKSETLEQIVEMIVLLKSNTRTYERIYKPVQADVLESDVVEGQNIHELVSVQSDVL
jgi:putative ATP-dependent endonuclease of OLD family